MGKKKEDNRDIFDKVMDPEYVLPAVAVGSVLAGRYVGRKAGKDAIKRHKASGRKDREMERSLQEVGERGVIRDYGQGGMIGFGALGGAPVVGYQAAKNYDEDRKKRRK